MTNGKTCFGDVSRSLESGRKLLDPGDGKIAYLALSRKHHTNHSMPGLKRLRIPAVIRH